MSFEQIERSLLVIDDVSLRRKAFARAADLLTKIDRLDETIRAFRDEDQKLYEEWSDLTFRAQRERIGKAREEYATFMRFHNDMVTVERLFDYDAPEAYRFLRDEQERWDTGSPQQRAEIDNARAKREQFMTDEIAREQREELERQQRRIRREQGARPRSERNERDLGERLRQMTDQEIEALFSRGDDLQQVLIFVYTTFALGGDPDTFRRFWKFASERTREEFRERLRQVGHGDAEIPGDDAFEDEEPEYPDESSAGPQANAHLSEDDQVKRLYRLLVRRLHPDTHASNEKAPTSWLRRAWQDLQSFVKHRDVRGLERLQALTILRTGALNELSFSDILASHRWVAEELHRRQQEAARLRGEPAWNFSKRKNFDTLTRKIQRELARELAEIEEELEVHRYQHQTLEAMSEKRARKQERKQSERPRRRAERW